MHCVVVIGKEKGGSWKDIEQISMQRKNWNDYKLKQDFMRFIGV